MTTTSPDTDAAGRPSDSAEATVYVLGDGHLGTALARRLRAVGREAVLLDEGVVEADEPADSASLDPDATVVVATPSDARNLLVAQLLRSRFDVDRVVVLANRPDRVEPVADAGHEPVCVTSVLSEALADRL